MTIATADRVDKAGLLEFLRERHHGILKTTRADGRPQLSPVTCGVDPEGRLVVSTYPQRAKARNARRDPLTGRVNSYASPCPGFPRRCCPARITGPTTHSVKRPDRQLFCRPHLTIRRRRRERASIASQLFSLRDCFSTTERMWRRPAGDDLHIGKHSPELNYDLRA